MDIKVGSIDINLREEMQIMQDEWGNTVLLVKALSMLCSCAKGQGQQSSPLCPLCLGIGRKIRLEKISAVVKEASQVISLPNNQVTTSIGEIYANAKIFYIKYEIKPTVGSYIYEISWYKDKPATIIGMYLIEYAEPYRMDSGKTEYYVCATHKDMTNIKFKQKSIKNLKIYTRI